MVLGIDLGTSGMKAVVVDGDGAIVAAATAALEVAPIRYEGPSSTNPLAFRYHDKDRMVAERRMEDHLRHAVCFWHSFSWPGPDVFGAGTLPRPWLSGPTVSQAKEYGRLP